MSESNFHDASFNHSILKDQESFDHMWATKLSLACLFIVESDQYITSVRLYCVPENFRGRYNIATLQRYVTFCYPLEITVHNRYNTASLQRDIVKHYSPIDCQITNWTQLSIGWCVAFHDISNQISVESHLSWIWGSILICHILYPQGIDETPTPLLM